MSHFTVMVIGPETEEELAAVLAPFDENRQTDPWFEPMSQDDIDHMAKNYECAATFAALAPHAEDWHGAPLHEVKGQLGYMSTYNPDSQWDYWRVGGRWAGTLRLKPGVFADLRALSWEWKDAAAEERPGEDRADRARLGDIDLTGWRLEVANAAAAEWDRWQKFKAVHGTPPAWEPPYSTEMRETRNNHPATIAMWEEYGARGAPDVKIGDSDRETFIVDEAAAAVPCFATLIPGEGWYAPGEMGCFGASTDDADDRKRYHAKVNTLLNNLHPATWITVVDCHI